MRRASSRVAVAVLTGSAFLFSGCGDSAQLPLSAGFGPDPQLPPPNVTLLPTVNIAPADGWHAGERPTLAPGLAVTAFATGLDHPRNVYVLPNGDVLVAETNAPPKPDDNPGLRGVITRWVMNRAGAGPPSANRLVLLRDTDGSGTADTRSVFLEGLNSPFGMALIGDQLFVADTDAIRRYHYHAGQTHGSVLTELPAGRINRHWTKNLVASPDDGSSTSASARIAMSARTAWLLRKGGRRFGKLTCAPAHIGAMRPGYVTPMGLPLRSNQSRCCGQP
jgi:glucose/arabinose dehydrogenase